MHSQRTNNTLKTLLNPKSVAVIGASNASEKVGYAVMKNLKEFGFRGEIIPINIHEKKVLGKEAYQSIKQVKKKIDLAIIVVPAPAVAGVMQECAEQGVKNAVIITAGFSETGAEGKQLEIELKKIVHVNHMTVVGPNTLGVINTHSNLNASFAPNSPKKGHIAVVSQSGALCAAILDWAKLENIGFSTFISTGNKTFLDEASYFEYLEKDEHTKAVIVYMESVHKPIHFLRHAARLARKKPVVILKAGRFFLGQKAAMSHTGAMSIDDAIFNVACKKANIIRAKSMERFFDLTKLLAKNTNLQGFRLGVVTNAGGPGVITADAADAHNFTLPSFTKRTLRAVQKINPNATNPLDLIGDAKPSDYETAIKTLQSDSGIDIIYALLTPQAMTNPKSVAQIIVALNKKKPILCSFLGGSAVEEPIKYLKENGIAVFETPERGIKTLSLLNEYYERKHKEELFSISTIKKRRLKRTVVGKKRLSLFDAFRLLKSEGINTPRTHFCNADAIKNITKTNFPIAIKAAGGIAHKTNFGLVKANINSNKELHNAAEEISAKLGAINEGVQVAVQEIIKGQEVFVSAIRTEFGIVITYGLGGIFVEVMHDFSQKIAPLTDNDVDEMLNEVKGTKILLGARTKQKYAINELKKLIKIVAKIALTYPEIKELELNPVIVTEKKAYAVDAVINCD